MRTGGRPKQSLNTIELSCRYYNR